MEEAKLIKTCSGKEPTVIDPSTLHQQCQEQLLRLNHQLGEHISCQRNEKLNRIIPDIASLGVQIREIENSICHEVTLEESTSQKQLLLHRKEALIANIQAHSRKIERFKRQMVLLNINHEELIREFEENSKIIKEKEMTCSAISQGKENGVLSKTSKKQSMPSLFSHKHSRLDTNRSSMDEAEDSESKWSKIDRLFDKLSALQFNGLSRVLVDLAKRQNGNIKGVFRNYKTNDRISEFAKSNEVRQQLYLLKCRKK